MRTYNIPNNEDLKIELHISDYGNDHEITVNDHCYALVILENGFNKYDRRLIADWVSNTYYDGCYLSNQYVPPTVRLGDFT